MRTLRVLRNLPAARLVALSLIALLFAACGGSDDDDGGSFPPPPPANRAPAATAGANQTGITGQSITLTGTATDADGDVLTYEWTIFSGPANGATLTGATTANATFSATIAGSYVVRLAAKDPANATGTSDLTVTITAPAASRVTVDKVNLFLTGVGQTATLTAQAFDGAGALVNTPVTWTSSAPNEVNVDSSGHVMATTLGSAQIFAHAGGATSQPVLVVVAETVPGTVLVTDAQIQSVGGPIGLAPGATPGVGTQYEVRLRGVAAPAAGTVVLAAESSPVAGKVIATRTDGEDLVVTLEIAPLYDLLARYHIDWDIDLSAYPLVPVNAPGASAAKMRPRAATRTNTLTRSPDALGSIGCEGSIEASLGSKTITSEITSSVRLRLQDYRDNPALPPNYSKHALEGSVAFDGKAEFELAPQVNASGNCKAEVKVGLPIGGWLSLIVMPEIAFGVGVDLNAQIVVASAVLGGELHLGLKPVVGWECTGAPVACHGVNEVTLDPPRFKPTAVFNVALDSQHAIASAHVYVFARLDAVLFRGLVDNVPIVEGRMGPKQSLDLAFPNAQAMGDWPASHYDLKVEGSIKPGAALDNAIKQLVNKDADSVAFGGIATTTISESPRGSFSADKTRVGAGDTVIFSVDINADSKDYLGLGANFTKGYNINAIELWRKGEDEERFTKFANAESIASGDSTAFQYDWTPAEEDIGRKFEFAAFANTKFPVPSLLISTSLPIVEVGCFSAGAAAKADRSKTIAQALGQQANFCADEWIGTRSVNLPHVLTVESSMTWKKADPQPPDQPPGRVWYKATGTLTFHHLVFEEMGCNVTPADYTIDPNNTFDNNWLLVDYSTTPATYTGSGDLAAQMTVNCPDDPPFTFPGSISFFSGTGSLNPGGATFSNTTTTSAGTTSYEFHRP